MSILYFIILLTNLYDGNLKMENDSNKLLNIHGVDYLFHMTHIDNLQSILDQGLYAHNNKYQKVDISDCEVNSRRSREEPIYHKSIHSYVPFYFNPKNNMLSKRRNIQDDIVILILKRELIFSKGALFTDGNASSDATGFSSDIKDLKKLDWECIYTPGYYSGYRDGGRKRMAEVLVPDYVNPKYIEGIICNNNNTKSKVDSISDGKYASLVHTNYYF